MDLNRKTEEGLLNVARLAEHQSTLWSLINDNYANASMAVKVAACENKNLSSEAIHDIVKRNNEFPDQVLIALTKNPNIARTDLVLLGRSCGENVAKTALRVQGLSNAGVATEFFYDWREDVSKAALDASFYGGYAEMSDELFKLLSATDNEAIKRVAILSIQDAVLLHQIANEARYNDYLSIIVQNNNVATATINAIINNAIEKRTQQYEHVLVQAAKHFNLNEDMFEKLLSYSVNQSHVGIYLALLENNGIPGHVLDDALGVKASVFIDPLKERFHLSEDTKLQMEIDLTDSKELALSKNDNIVHEYVSEKYGINALPEPKEVLEIDNIKFEDVSIDDLYDRISIGIVDDQFSDDLMRVADNQDMDPDLQMTIMLALMGKEGNRLSTLNSMQNAFDGRASSLLGFVGKEGVQYKKNARSYISIRKFTPIQKARIAIRAVAHNLSQVSEKVVNGVARQVTQAKTKLPTNEMTNKDLSKKEVKEKQTLSSIKQLKFLNRKRVKKGRGV